MTARFKYIKTQLNKHTGFGLEDNMNLERIIAVRTGKTVYRDGDKVIKVFDSDYSKADVLNEALNQSRIEETGLNIPKIHEVSMVDGKWAIVSDYIEGKTLEQMMKDEPDKYDEYLKLFIDIQLDIFSRKAPLLNKLKDKLYRKINETDLTNEVKYELQTRLESMPKHDKVCHGDFNPSNIIIDKEGKPYIIDWAHATQGNSSADVARTYLLFWLNGDISGADKYLNEFSKKSGIAKKYIQSWLPLVAAEQSLKGKPEEREFLLHWINVVDFE